MKQESATKEPSEECSSDESLDAAGYLKSMEQRVEFASASLNYDELFDRVICGVSNHLSFPWRRKKIADQETFVECLVEAIVSALKTQINASKQL